MKMGRLRKALLFIVATISTALIQYTTAECTVPGAETQGGSCLLASRFYTTWTDAYRFCSSLGCTMAAPENDIKISEIKEYSKSVGLNFELYLGGTDSNSEGTFVRAGTGKPLVNMDWALGEPNGHREENCLMTENVHNFTIFDTSCDRNMRFICDCTPPSIQVLDSTVYA